MDYYGWKLYLFLILWIILSVNTQALKDNSTSGFPVVYRTTTAITADDKLSSRTINKAESECPQNHYKVGLECLLCGCSKKRDCVSETGQCPENSCKAGRFGLGCVYGILSIRNEKVNPRQPTNVTCIIRTDNISRDSEGIQMTTGSKPLNFRRPNERYQDGDNQLGAIFYLTDGLLSPDNYTCSMKQADGQTLSRTSAASVYELPVLSRSPEVHDHSFTDEKYTQLILHGWDPDKGDSGDGPVESYIIKACQHTESQLCRLEDYPDNFRYMSEQPAFSSELYPVFIAKALIPGATYSFIYKAKRPGGMYGTGPPSPPLVKTIPCRHPSVGPRIHKHNYTMDLSEEWRKVNVTLSWQLPSEKHIKCNYISAVTVKFRDLDSNEMFTSVLEGAVTSLTSLLNPYSLYTVIVSYENNAKLVSTVDILNMNRTLSAVPAEPLINHIYLVNSSVVKVNWSAPLQPNGKISQYQVFYMGDNSNQYEVGCIGNADWISYTNSYICHIHHLELHQVYSFKIRAKNSAGYGDNSTEWSYKLDYQAPDSVTTLTNSSKTDRSIYLTWTAPENTGGLEIKSYKLTCQQGDFRVQYTVPHTDTKQVSFNITKLEHSTKYTCNVVACNREGCCNTTHDRAIYTNPPEPSPPAVPEFKEQKNTDTSIALEIKSTHGCGLYRVVVMDTSIRAKRSTGLAEEKLPTMSIPEDCGKCCDSSCYVAAELKQDQLPMIFFIGDNKSYNGFYNAPLVTGRQYKIWYGAGNVVDGMERFEFVALEQSVVAREYVGEPRGMMSSSALIGTIVAVCLCAVVIILLLMVFLIRHRRNKMFRFRTPDSEKVLELNENGHLLPNGTYQKGDAVSVDSLDMSKQPNGEPVYDNVRLKKFPIMVEELREYIEQMSTKEGFKKEYNLIPWGLRYSREVAIQPDNKLKNRYGNIIAYDHSRVILKGKNLDQDTDYINANYIDGYTTPKEYIATQGPTKLTVNDLWYMAWQEKTKIIVMVTNTVESTRNKCEQYWPDKDFVQYGNIKVTVSHCKSLAHYKIRTFTMEKDGESRTIKQFHFTAWPDHGTPTHATTLLSFLKKVRQQKSAEDGPIICHCSAGVGRSGTFIALDSLLQQAELEGKVDVYNYVTQMREQRCNMVQTLDQYIFLHDALLEASEGFDTIIPLSQFKIQYDALRSRQSKGKSQIQNQYEKLQDLLYIDRSTDASSKENQIKNRCANVIPFNHRRVKLHNMPSDYINATFVDDHRKRMSLIATQHPLTNTAEDFWKMVELEKPFAVVTLCASSAVSDCKDKQDLPKFWPTMECRSKEHTSVSVELLDESPLDKIPGVVKQTLTVTNKNQKAFQPVPVSVDHYLCDFWSSQKALPSNKESLLKLVSMLDRRKQENDDRALVVNCYDGAKQTGLYLACHCLLQQLLMDSEVDVPEIVKLLRNDQPMFIPSVEQYQGCYDFVYEYVDKVNQDSAVFTHL